MDQSWKQRRQRRRICTPRRAIGSAAVLMLALTALGLWGCSTTIIPPSPDRIADDPVTVYLADYGRHTTILLPLNDLPDDERRVEYGFGEWKYFGLNKKGPGGVFRALLVPTDGTLSRRYVDGPFDEATLTRRLLLQNFHAFDVHRSEAVGLRQKLDQRFDENIETKVFNERRGLYHVRVDERYSLANNCNPVLARWLEQVGCEIRGPAMLSNWNIRSPE